MIASQSRPKSRRGITLVELLAAMATLTIVLGLAVALITMLLKLSASGQDGMANDLALARVSRLFREDVRAAGEVRQVAAGTPSKRLSLVSGESSVEYWANGDRIDRSEWEAGELVKQERLTLLPSSSPRFERRTEPGRTVVVLVIDRSAKTPGGSKLREYRVEATAGASLRFESGGPSR